MPGDDEILDQFETVGAVADLGFETGHRGDDPHDVLVGGVAGVDDPRASPEAVERPRARIAVVRHGRGVGGHAEAPGGRPQSGSASTSVRKPAGARL